MRRILTRGLATVAALSVAVLAGCELLLLILLLLLMDIDNPFVLFEHIYFSNGITYYHYEYGDGTDEFVAVRGADVYSQFYDADGKLVRVENDWTGTPPNPSNPGKPPADPGLEALMTIDKATDKALTRPPRGRSDAGRGNPDDQEEAPKLSPVVVPSEGSPIP
jgi:hypothetical protein